MQNDIGTDRQTIPLQLPKVSTEQLQLKQLQTMQLPNQKEIDPADIFSGVETINLSVPDPEPAEHFALVSHKGASFHKKKKEIGDRTSWLLDDPEDRLKFKLTLPQKHGVVFILELRRTRLGEDKDAPITIDVNGHERKVEIDPRNLHFHRESWYLPHYQMEQGKNLITVSLSPYAKTNVQVRTASVMRFHLQHQKQTKWCWAAVTASLLNFFDRERGMTQCRVVKQCLPKVAVCPICRQDVVCPSCAEVDCCENGDKPACNRTYKLAEALDKMNVQFSRCNYPISIDEIREQIHQGLPVAVRIDWGDGRGHFVVITAVGPDDSRGDKYTWLRIADPLNGDAATYNSYDTLKNSYDGDGQWSHTYLFKRKR
jgi:hypothetical protein